MLNFDIYAIYTKDNVNKGTIKELFTSFHEAEENRFKYGNYDSSNGDVWIHYYKANSKFTESHSWHLNKNGDIISEFDWEK